MAPAATIELNEAEPANGRNRTRPTQREHFRRKPNHLTIFGVTGGATR